MTDIERAMLDIAEVRDRLAMTQRFRGISGVAAIASGCFAIAAGVLQALLVAVPHGAYEQRVYASIWLVCGTAAMIVNYGSIAHWFVSDASVRDRWQTRTVGLAILPAIALGAAITLALVTRGAFGYLPGVWYGCYGVGLFASRMMLPRDVLPIAAFFLVAGMALLFAPASIALAWWVLPLGFGIGHIAIGVLVARDRREHP
ncbi:MAG TPA: hypothetical protein VK702_07430 [Candidatus Acidoferrum sp.]|jgi:hypothetical protein|nr:hypothetical protein [Candidatus Acidoferrum sp.]